MKAQALRLHPFPQLLNKSLNIVVQLETEQHGLLSRRLAVVQVPRVLPRLIRLPAPEREVAEQARRRLDLEAVGIRRIVEIRGNVGAAALTQVRETIAVILDLP